MKAIQQILVLILLSSFLGGCVGDQKKQTSDKTITDLELILSSDTLRVGTIFSPTSYFTYQNDFLGYDYELVEDLAEFMNVNIKITTAQAENELEELLENNKIDLIAFSIYETAELKKRFRFVMQQSESNLVIVQRLSTKTISDVTELEGKIVHVKKNPIYKQRLENLQMETGDSFEIVESPDSVTLFDLIEMVAGGKIEYTVAHYKTAHLYKSYFKNINVRMPIGFEQQNGWLIRNDSEKLEEKIQEWVTLEETKTLTKHLQQKYWVQNPFLKQVKIKIPKGAISPYDQLFKKYAAEISWDWKLLASLAFHESGFDSAQVSWAGASGLMQLMPRTAGNFGLDKENIFNPEKNIDAAVQYIKSLNMIFRKIENKDERIKFIIASYNSGPAHIFDARALASKYGKNPNIWFNHVEYFVRKISEPEFYNDPVVKYGRFRAKETLAHVVNTLETYEKYSGNKIDKVDKSKPSTVANK